MMIFPFQMIARWRRVLITGRAIKAPRIMHSAMMINIFGSFVLLFIDTDAKAKPHLIRCQGVLINYLIIYLVHTVDVSIR